MAYRAMDAVLAAERKVQQIAHFETTTSAKIEKRIKQDQLDRMRRERDANLINRQRALAELYETEMEQWKDEVLSKVETVEERKARIMERAYALRDARESARLEYVKRRYDDQWRDACDDARTLDSESMTAFMAKERLRQMEEKIKKKQMLNSDETAWLAEWNRQLDIIAERDRAKLEYRKKCDMDTEKGLRQQIEYNMKMKQDNYDRTMEEDLDEIRRIREAIAAEEALQKKKSDEAKQRGKEVLQFNAQFKIIEAERLREEAEQNAILLEYAMRKEREQIAAEEAKKNAARNASLQFRKYLEEQMIKEAEDTAFVDEINKREEAKVWKARDDALQAREDARNHLMKLVDEGRQEQIRRKREEMIREKESEKIYVKKFIEDAKEGIRLEQDAAIRRREKAAANNEKLSQQIELRRRQEELAKQETYLADKQMKYIERQHQLKLAEQGGAVRLNRPLQKNNWYT